MLRRMLTVIPDLPPALEQALVKYFEPFSELFNDMYIEGKYCTYAGVELHSIITERLKPARVVLKVYWEPMACEDNLKPCEQVLHYVWELDPIMTELEPGSDLFELIKAYVKTAGTERDPSKYLFKSEFKRVLAMSQDYTRL